MVLGVSAIVFGLVHLGAGAKMFVVSTIAGMAYGWVYQRSRAILSAIILHFIVNAVHILFSSILVCKR